jgi:hypothetical protein
MPSVLLVLLHTRAAMNEDRTLYRNWKDIVLKGKVPQEFLPFQV